MKHSGAKSHLKYPCTLGLASCLLLAPLAEADSFRCGRKVVRTGDSPAELRQRCGDPLEQDSGYAEFWQNGRLQKVRVKRWHYKPGTRKLERIVLIYKGEIVGIQTGDR